MNNNNLTKHGQVLVQPLFSFLQGSVDEFPALVVCTAEYLEANGELDDDISLNQFPHLFEEAPLEEDDDCIFYFLKNTRRFRFYDMGYATWGVEEIIDGEYNGNSTVDESALMLALGQAGLLKDDLLLQYF